MIPQKLNSFLKQEKTAVLSLPVDDNGTIHSAALLFSHSQEPVRFYFITGRSTEKCKKLLAGESQKASVVIGMVKDVDFTLQMRGEVRIIEKSEEIINLHQAKFPGGMDKADDENNVLLEFKPHWGSYCNYSKGFERHMLELN